jgi:tetratricopeptide (TPR) repeat protein
MIEGGVQGVKEGVGGIRRWLDLRFWRSLYFPGFARGHAPRAAGPTSSREAVLPGIVLSSPALRTTYKGAQMRTRFSAAVLAVAVGLSALPLAGCHQFNSLKAKVAFKDANAAYQSGDYRKAVAKYEDAVAKDPELTSAYFYLANSYDNLYKPARKGEAANDQNLTKAIDYYKKSSEVAEDPKLRKLSLEYLVAAYRDKLEDPSQAEPVVQRMIQMEPNEPTNYFVLSKIYEDAGNYEQAEATLLKARDARPNDPSVYMQIASYYNRQGQFDKTIDALEQRASKEPGNPEAYYTIATYYWDKAFRDKTLKDPEKKAYVEKGVEAADRALKIKGDYMEAMVYKGLLLRLEANLEKDRTKQLALLKEADALRDQANELRKKKSAGAGAASASE